MACVRARPAAFSPISSQPTVEIVLNHEAANSAGVHFSQAFRMLVRRTMTRSRRSAVPAVAAIAWLLPIRAAAQSIDYGAFQELFGEPVTTSATGIAATRHPTCRPTWKSSPPTMIRRPAPPTFPDALAHVIGVDVLRWGVTSADVGIRGYDTPFSPRLLVLVNGRQVYLDDWGRTQWDAIPVQLAEIRQIEVVKGPNTALFGFNAAAGVINIITYNPLYDTVNTASVAGGTQGFAQASAVGTAKLGDVGGIRVSAGGLSRRRILQLSADGAADRLCQQLPWQGAVSADLHDTHRRRPGVRTGSDAFGARSSWKR